MEAGVSACLPMFYFTSDPTYLSSFTQVRAEVYCKGENVVKQHGKILHLILRV